MLLGLTVALALLVPAAAGAAAPSEPLTGRVLVALRPPAGTRAGAASLDARIAPLGGRVQGPVVPQLNMVRLTPPPGVSLSQFVSVLRRDPAVASAQLETSASPRAVPDSPALTVPETATGTPAGVPVEWWAQRLNLYTAWSITQGQGVKVAVIDSGIDAQDPEFAGKIAGTYIDDALNDGPATQDQVGHGTHVSGLACAYAPGVGMVGAGFDCDLVVEKSDLSEGSVATEIVNATNQGASVINMSFGTEGTVPAPPELTSAINYAVAHDVVLVAAASDASVVGQAPVQQQGDPCNVLQPTGTGPYLNQGKGLCVTSADYAGDRSSFAGAGSQISLAAFGSFSDSSGPPGIFSTFPANPTTIETGTLVPYEPPCGVCRTTFEGASDYAYLEGTSMATPMVAGIAGLVRAVNPGLSAIQIVRILKETAQRPPGVAWTPDLGWGIVNAGLAVEAGESIDTTPPVASEVVAPKHTTATTITLHWVGADPSHPPQITSGIAYYKVYRGLDNGIAQQIATASSSSLVVHVRPGHLYGWYVLAVDKAGNKQAHPVFVTHTRVLVSPGSAARRRKHR
ncbi:MAG TPA: S8 family serine peptidase [Solirubrobacteraceae bacterium]|nr:S8 family serine peptidase [Solirubrobacteraceae bacterium]